MIKGVSSKKIVLVSSGFIPVAMRAAVVTVVMCVGYIGSTPGTVLG